MATLRPRRRRIFWRKSRPPVVRRIVLAVLAGLASAGAAALAAPLAPWTARSSEQRCDIKGNVSQNTGERIYHAPGQRYYDAVRIRPERGERWFCSEADARAAGWRRAKL